MTNLIRCNKIPTMLTIREFSSYFSLLQWLVKCIETRTVTCTQTRNGFVQGVPHSMTWDSNFDCYRPLNDAIIEKGYLNKEVDFWGISSEFFRNNNSCGFWKAPFYYSRPRFSNNNKSGGKMSIHVVYKKNIEWEHAYFTINEKCICYSD